MASQRALVSDLKKILRLLQKEKKALIANDIEKLTEIINNKNESIERLAAYKGMDVKNIKEAMDIIGEINSIQELNLLLTKQALSFQEAILESISTNVNNASNTYSNKGKYESAKEISLIDHSV